ncbi:MAG: hypothetical protein FWC99_03260 [Coriobacteriia bacterium]|nr:hypothetical protein [Coriobacteriia bacterium]
MMQLGINNPLPFPARVFISAITVLLAGLFALSPAVAIATESETEADNEYAEAIHDTATTQVAQFDVIQYKVLQSEDMWVARVIVQLAEHEPLPATIEVAVPQHSAVFHFGEDGQGAFPSPLDMRIENGFDIYTGIMTQARIATLEYTLPVSPFEQTSAGPSINVSYTPLHNVEELWLIAALPPESAVTDQQFRYIGSGPHEEPAFAYIVEDAIGGQEYTTQIAYIANAGDLTSPSDNTVALIILVVFLVIVAAVVLWLFKRGRTTPTTVLLCAFLLAGFTFAGTAVAGASEEVAVEDPRGIRTQDAAETIEPFVNLQYKVMLWEGAWTVTVRGKIDEHALLPATVEIGVPAGSEIFWLGEVYAEHGNPPTSNPEISPPYNMRTEGDIDIYTAVITEAHAIQIEYNLPYDPRIETEEGPGLRITYTPLHDVEQLWLAGATPPETAVLDRNIRYLGTGPHGELAFAYVIDDATGGQEYSEDIIFTTGIAETETNVDPLVPIGIAASMLLLAGGGFWYYKRGAYKADTK